MHPPAAAPPRYTRKPLPPQFRVTPQHMAIHFETKIPKDSSSAGPFCWSPRLISLFMGDRPSVHTLASLGAAIVNQKVPPLMMYILRAARMVPLHKLDEEARREVAQRGEDPHLRPIEPPTIFLKYALDIPMRDDTIKRKISEYLEPLQLSVGSSHGPARTAHLLKAAMQAGASALHWDEINAFNELNR